MEVDVLILFENGVPVEQEVIKHTGTAEAAFEVMASKVLSEVVVEDLKENCMSSDDLYDDVNSMLKGQGREILWLCRIEVNKFK